MRTNSLKRNNWIVTYMKTKVINKEGEGFNHGNFETSGVEPALLKSQRSI